MHRSVLEFGKEVLLPEYCHSKRIIEIGSKDINGSLRPYVESLKPSEYIGTDFQPGRGVDKVINVNDLLTEFGKESFDVIISTEMLEHCEDWKRAIEIMFSLCKMNGIILLTARGPGFRYHAYPYDYWRFTVKDIEKIFKDNAILHNRKDFFSPGILSQIQKTSEIVHIDFDVISIKNGAEK